MKNEAKRNRASILPEYKAATDLLLVFVCCLYFSQDFGFVAGSGDYAWTRSKNLHPSDILLSMTDIRS